LYILFAAQPFRTYGAVIADIESTTDILPLQGEHPVSSI
jgi:hypothetical protein